MAANFEVKFIVDRVSGNYKIRITDTSTGFSLVKANTKITFPDGYVLENTDVSNPDISSAGGYVEKNARLDVVNKVVTGDYKINFTGYDASDNEYTSQKQFNFTWSEPSIVIQDLSDSGVPVVKFKDITVWDEGNFTETATTREFSVDYPSTSAVSGNTKTSSQTDLGQALEIDMIDDLQYYEGIYDVGLNADILYSHTNGYLTVQYKKNSSQDFTIKRTPSQSDLLDKISQYKANIDAYKTTNPSLYKKYAEDYDNVLALYSHAVSRYKLGIGDGAQDSIDELLDLIDDQTPHVYLSTPLTGFSIDENDFGAVAQVVKLKSEIGTFDSDGNLQTIAKAFADELFEVEATDFKAEASKLSTLLAQFGTYDPSTDTFSFLATADYFEQVKTYADNDKASAVALNILFSQFGTYDPNTETFTFSSTADYFNEVKTYADNDKASAQKLTTLTSQFGSYDPNTNTFTFDNTADYFEEVKTYADENSAAANKVSSLGSTFGSFDGNTFSTSEAKITEELNTYTGLNFSNSTYFQNIEADIESKPLVFRQAAEPSVTEPVGSIWYDTDDENKVYILVSGTPNVWTLTDDERIGASASKITSMSAKFGSFDGNDFTLNNTDSDYWNAVKLYADTNSAAATKVENLGAELVTFNPDNTVDSITLSSDFSSAIDTFVSDVANSALASKVEGLRVDIEGQDGTGGLTAQVTTNANVVAARPKIFRQDDAPATTEPEGSLWFDTNDSNKAYVLVGDDGDPETFTWTVTRDEGLISSIEDKPFIFRQDDAPATTNPEGSIWYDTNDGNKLYVLISSTWTLTQDSDIATAQATADGRPKVFRQAEAPDTTEPEFSVWYDTDDNNLSYVLIGDGGDPETFTWTETVDGRVTDLLEFAEARYSLNVDANGVVTGLELYSASGPNTTVSTFKITADKFIVRESSTDFVPFELDGEQLKLSVPLNGVSGTFSGDLVAAGGTFSGSLVVGEVSTSVGTVVSGAALGATANQDDTATILAGEHTGEVSGDVTGTIDGTSASTVKSGAADGATAKGVTDNLTSVVAITNSDIAIVLEDETKTFNDDGTPFYVDNTGQFSLGDKLSYDPSTNTLSVTGAVTIESVSGLTKSDVGLGNVDNNSTATILAGDLTGTIDGTAVATVKSGAADGASAKAETDKLTSVVSLTNSDIAIVNSGETKTYNDAGTPFYVDNTGQFSLGNKLSFDGSDLNVSGTITMSSTSTIDGATASTVKSGAADGASAKGITDNLTSVVSITSSDIAIINEGETKTFNDAGTPFYVDNTGQFSLGSKLSFDGSVLSIDGEVTATSGSIGGINIASSKIYSGSGMFDNVNTAFYLDSNGQFSLRDKLAWDGSTLSVNGEITSTSGNIGGWLINSTELKSPAVNSVNRLEFSPTAGFKINDDDNDTALLVNYGGLTSLSSTTTGATFADVSNAEVTSWDETVSAGNTLIKIPASNERHIYSSNYLTASFENDPKGGSYAYEISIDAITGAIATLTGTSTYLKATLALHVQIATDTTFNTVIKDVELYRTDVTGATTITFPGISNKAISFSISDNIQFVYLRFYWYRMYAVAYNDSITWSPKTFNVSSADANDDLVFLIYKGTTELTNEGVQIINDPTTYFKVDRANFTSGNPYVDIGGDVKVDGNFTVTGNINLEGDVENSDVTVSNLVERLGEINTSFTLGSSALADVTFAGDVQVDGTLKGPATFTIDPSAYGDATGKVVILGDLQVDGTTTTINSTNVTIDDKILTLSSGAADSTAANDSGIEIDGASAYFKYFHTGTKWVSNKNIEAGTFIGALSGNASSASTAAQLTTARTISLTGTITGSASFDGTADVSIATTTSFDLQDVTTNGASTSNTVTFTGGSSTTPAVYVKSGGNSWSEGLVIHPAADNSWNGIYFSESATIGTQTGVWFVGNSGETGYVNDFYILKRDSNYGSALGNTTAALRINKADGSLHSHSHTVNGQLFLNRSNGTINSANSAIQIENPTGTQSMIYFDFAGSNKGSIRVDSQGNMVLNALNGDFYFNNDFGTGGVVDLINTNTTFLSATSGGNVNIPVTLTATTMFTSNTITTSASSGSVLLKHNVSEANSWIFQENAGNWGLFWLNDGGESGQTIGTYTTVGAEVFGMNNAVTGFNPSSAWSGTDSNSRAAWMLSNYTGDFWSQGRQYSENSMVSPVYYDTNTAYYLDASSHGNIGSIRINRDWNTSGIHPEQLTVRGTYASMALRSTTQNANWLFHNDGSFRLYSDSATDGNNWVEQFRVDQGGVATITRGRLNIEGTDVQPIKITGASHKYLTINPGNGYEAMVRYIGGSGSSWYVGKRTSGQLIGTDNFHFYSEAAGATVGGINTSGDLLTIGSVQSPTFYDSNNTGYYADPAGTSNFNALNVSLINNIAPDRNVLGKRVSYSSLSGSSGDWFPLLQVTDSNGPVYASVSTYAHSSVAFTCSGGYGPSNQPSLTVLNSTWNPNGGFANVNGIRIRQDGWVEIRLSWGSGPTVDIDVQAWDAAGSVVTFAGSLATTTATNAIKMTVDQFPTGMLAANYIYGQVQMQSPIYYDFDNTAYYVDPASQTTIRKTNIIASGSGWDDGLNLYSSDTANRWNILVDDGAGDWLRFAYNNSEKIRVETNGVATFLNDLYSSYSMRAQTFYDTNNTTYFLNPDSTGTSLHIAGSVEAATYYKPGLLLNSSGTGSSGAALGMQQVTGEGWTGIFVDYEPYTGWGLYHDNPNNYFCITAEGSTGNLRSFTVPSRTSGNRTAYEKIRFDQNNGNIIAGGSVYAQSSIYASYFGDYQTNFIFRTGINTGTTRHINLANTTSDPSVALGTGISWGQRTDGQPYYIIRTILDNYNGNYTKLNLNWHTGINIGANPQYGGVRFYSDAFGISSTVVASIASGDNNMRSNYDIIAYASDKRLKTNVEPITNAVDKVKSLTGMTYNWNEVGNDYGWEAPKEREAGVFAQDVQAVLPEAVRLAPFDHSSDADGNPVSKSGEDFLTVKYEKLVPLLIEAIKEQQEQIDELKSIINTLKS